MKKIPHWIRGKIVFSEDFVKMKDLLALSGLNTVCVEASCPNKGECWDNGHVTFMILGNNCTRGCKFCDVARSVPNAVDISEPSKIADAINDMGIKYAVLTSVTRDDMDDKGAGHFIETVSAIKDNSPETIVEILIPDMDAREDLLRGICCSGADVIGHNIEMPEKLYGKIRPSSGYGRSMSVLRFLKNTGKGHFPVKTSIMVGLGEDAKDLKKTFFDLKDAGVDILYVGQYLRPTKSAWCVEKYYEEEEFRSIETMAREIGFSSVLSGPMVRSSYRAGEIFRKWREHNTINNKKA